MVHHDPELREKAWNKLYSKGRVGIKDAALILNLHYTTVSDYVALGYIPTITISNRHSIQKRDLLHFIEHGKPNQQG